VTERPKRATFKEDPTRTNEQEAKWQGAPYPWREPACVPSGCNGLPWLARGEDILPVTAVGVQLPWWSGPCVWIARPGYWCPAAGCDGPSLYCAPLRVTSLDGTERNSCDVLWPWSQLNVRIVQFTVPHSYGMLYRPRAKSVLTGRRKQKSRLSVTGGQPSWCNWTEPCWCRQRMKNPTKFDPLYVVWQSLVNGEPPESAGCYSSHCDGRCSGDNPIPGADCQGLGPRVETSNIVKAKISLC
jgi:hypothetical protein